MSGARITGWCTGKRKKGAFELRGAGLLERAVGGRKRLHLAGENAEERYSVFWEKGP